MTTPKRLNHLCRRVPLIIIKKATGDLLTELATEQGFIEKLVRINGQRMQFEQYQRDFLTCRDSDRVVNKSRRVGMSFISALEALARCHLRDGHSALFISYNLRDAQEKIAEAKLAYESLPLAFQRRIIVDTKTELKFASNSRGQRPSRILSFPSKATRGQEGDVYMDELAHCEHDRQIFIGSTASIVREDKHARFNRQVTCISTPLGPRGVFWDITTQTGRAYPGFTRFSIPWWHSEALCHNVAEAKKIAPHLDTHARVKLFGKPKLQEQLLHLGNDDFEQEFECGFVDEATSFFPYELIMSCCDGALELLNTTTDLIRAQLHGRVVAGYDVGRTKDHSALSVYENMGGFYQARMLKAFKGAPFQDQKATLRQLLQTGVIHRLSIDGTGIGMNLAEDLKREFPGIIHVCPFTNASKERWATTMKTHLERQAIILPNDQHLVRELHSIRRVITAKGHISYTAPRNNQGHADRAWATMLAVQDERHIPRRRAGTVTASVLG